MITKFILTSLCTVLLSSGLIYKSEHADKNDNIKMGETTEHVTRAILVNDEVFPHILLPEVEITGKLGNTRMVKAIKVNGEVLPLIELEEVVIMPNLGIESI